MAAQRDMVAFRTAAPSTRRPIGTVTKLSVAGRLGSASNLENKYLSSSWPQARAAAFGSKVIILDEPTAALGVRESRRWRT